MAQRILVEGGLFVMHSGQYYLDQVMRPLGEHLTWRWMIASEWAGDANMVHPLDLGFAMETDSRLLQGAVGKAGSLVRCFPRELQGEGLP